MNKFLLSLLIYCASILAAFGQDSLHITHEDTFKARRNHFVTELNINPLKGDLSLNNALNQIKLRFFTADYLALRLGFSVNTVKDNSSTSSPYGTNPFINDELKKAATASINAGFEKHFMGTRRLSPYLGAEVMFANKTSSHNITNSTSSTKIEGAWRQQTYSGNPNYPVITSGYAERAFFRYGVNLVTGFDFYMAKHFYFGYEITFGLSNTMYTDIDTSIIYTSGSGDSTDNPVVDYEDKSFSLGANLINGIRLGYAF